MDSEQWINWASGVAALKAGSVFAQSWREVDPGAGTLNSFEQEPLC